MDGGDVISVFALSLLAESPFLDAGDNSGQGFACTLQRVDTNFQFRILLDGCRRERADIDFAVPFQCKSLSTVGMCLRNNDKLLTG